MTKNDLIEKAVATLDEAKSSPDAEQRDSLTRVAQGYANLLPFVE